MSLFGDNDKARKNLPIFKYITRYCPKALREMTKVSVVNNVRYNPEREPADINWARDKSKDQLGSSLRHMMESAVDGKVFEEVPPEIQEKTGITRVYILAENAWRAVAALELEIERVESEEAKADSVQLGNTSIAAGSYGGTDSEPDRPVDYGMNPRAAFEGVSGIAEGGPCVDSGPGVATRSPYRYHWRSEEFNHGKWCRQCGEKLPAVES